MTESSAKSKPTDTKQDQQLQKKDEFIHPRFRIKDPWEKPKMHPMYITTGSEYGKHNPTKETSSVRRGKPSKFAKQFTGGMWRDNGLNTSIDKTFIK